MRRFTNSHEWIELDGQEGTVGVTAYAQKELGEIVFVNLPDVGTTVATGDEAVILESTKAAADIYAPVSGVITAVNHSVKESPDLLNQSPEGEGWLYKISLTNSKEIDQLISWDEYEKMVKNSFSS